MTTPRLLVTGATGLLGRAIVQEAAGRYDVWGWARGPRRGALPCELQRVDLTDGAGVARAMQEIAPAMVIHAAAMTSIAACEADPAQARRVNVEGTRHLLHSLEGRRCRFLYISTDSVFDGRHAPYRETDPANPLHVYGTTKLEAEALVMNRAESLIVRTVFYGWGTAEHPSLAEQILFALRQGAAWPGLKDVRFSPLVTTQVARLLIRLCEMDAAGWLQLGSRDGGSKYDFAARLAERFGFDRALVRATQSGELALHPPRPQDVTLDTGRAASVFGQPMPDVAEGLDEFARTEPVAAR